MKSLLLSFVLVLSLQGTIQKQGPTENQNVEERTFIGLTMEPDLSPSPRSPSPCPPSPRSPSPCPSLPRSPLPRSFLPRSPSLQLLDNSTIEYLSGPLSTKIIPSVYILVLTVGVPANIAILCSLLTKSRKVSSSILYCSLAVTDLFLLLSLFFKADYHLRGNHWVLGEAVCRVVTACFYGNLYCSAQTLACISVMRYMALVRPFTYRHLPQKRITALVCFVNWTVFGAAVVPELLVQQSFYLHNQKFITCHDVLPLGSSTYQFLLPYNIALTIFGLLVPLVVTIWSYNRIMRALNRSHLDWAKYIKASSLVLVIFVVCFAPAGILHLVHYVMLSVDRTASLYAWFNVAVCLCCVHACLDPFLFLLMSNSTSQQVDLKKDTTGESSSDRSPVTSKLSTSNSDS